MTIAYQNELELSTHEFSDVLHRSGLAERRPAKDMARLRGMLRNANVIVTARDETGLLVGVSRAISDLHYCTYLSDLAVDISFQSQGIGRKLIERTHELAGKKTTLILLAAPAAADYYPRIGMQAHESCWMIPASS